MIYSFFSYHGLSGAFIGMKTVGYTNAITPGSYANVAVNNQGLITSGVAAVKCIVKRAADVAIAGTSAITWDTVSYDPGSIFNGTDGMTIPVTGVYIITYAVVTTSLAQPIFTTITSSGTEVGGRTYGILQPSNFQQVQIADILYLSAGSVVRVFYGSGATLNVLGGVLFNRFTLSSV
jgi:hypothetical protein